MGKKMGCKGRFAGEEVPLPVKFRPAEKCYVEYYAAAVKGI